MKKLFMMFFCFTILGIINLKAVDPVLSFTQSTYNCSEAAGTFQIAVAIQNPSGNPTSVDINVLPGGSAVNGVNFTYSPITVTFPANSSNYQFITVNVLDDSIPDGDKFLTFSLASPTNNATLGTDSIFTLTMRDADTLKLSINPTSVTIKQTGGMVVNMPVTLSHFSNMPTVVNVEFDPTGTTLQPGIGFDLYTTSLTWAPGTSGTQNIGIGLYYYTYYLPQRTLRLKLVNPTNGAILLDSLFTIILQPNGSSPCTELFLSQYILGTGNNQAMQIYNPTSQAIDLSNYRILKNSTANGISTSYFNLSGMLNPGAVYNGVNPLADAALLNYATSTASFFALDTFDNVALLHGADTIDVLGVLGLNPANDGGWFLDTGRIAQNTLIRNYYVYGGSYDWNIIANTWNTYPLNMFDSISFHHTAPCGTNAYPKIEFNPTTLTVPDSAQTIRVPVKMTYDGPARVLSYFIGRDDSLSTALPGVDYSFANGSVNRYFTHTVTYDTFTLYVLQNTIVQSTRKAIIHAFNGVPGLGAVQDSTFTLYITNNNKLLTSFLGAGFSYVENAGDVEVKLVLTSPFSVPVSVNVSQAPGSATNGVDYTFNDTTITFPAYSIDTQGVWLHIIDDNIVERNEQVNFNMTCLTPGVALGVTAYTLTIIDNDSVPPVTGIADNYANDNIFKIYPNPAANQLYIKSGTDLQGVYVTDLLGNILMYKGNITAGTNTLDISALPAGMYFVNMQSNDKTYSRHFVKTE